jgi:hypothetical protein
MKILRTLVEHFLAYWQKYIQNIIIFVDETKSFSAQQVMQIHGLQKALVRIFQIRLKQAANQKPRQNMREDEKGTQRECYNRRYLLHVTLLIYQKFMMYWLLENVGCQFYCLQCSVNVLHFILFQFSFISRVAIAYRESSFIYRHTPLRQQARWSQCYVRERWAELSAKTWRTRIWISSFSWKVYIACNEMKQDRELWGAFHGPFKGAITASSRQT